jgi:hypothetical protein
MNVVERHVKGGVVPILHVPFLVNAQRDAIVVVELWRYDKQEERRRKGHLDDVDRRKVKL